MPRGLKIIVLAVAAWAVLIGVVVLIVSWWLA